MLTSPKDVAKLVRAELKKFFPQIKFSVTSDYNSVNVRYTIAKETDPTGREVEAKLFQFKAGYFDGMTDSYEYSPASRGKPTVKFLFVTADDDAISKAHIPDFLKYYGLSAFEDQIVMKALGLWAEIALRRYMYEVIFKREEVEEA